MQSRLIALAVLIVLVVAGYGYRDRLFWTVAAVWMWVDPGPPAPPFIEENRLGFGSEDITAFLERRFPPGTPTDLLSSYLSRQGFVVEADSASYHWSDLVCTYLISVRWEAVDGSVEIIAASYDNVCL